MGQVADGKLMLDPCGDLLAVRTEAEKYLLLGTLNLVECVAFVGSASTSS